MAPDVGEPHRSLGPREPLPVDGYVVLGASSTFAASRPLRTDEAIYAVCDQHVERVDRPSLTAIGVAEVEWGDGGVYPEYRYQLPCAARVVLSGTIPGIRTGPYASAPLRDRVGVSPRTITLAPGTVQFVGDLTGDTRADVIFEVGGDMGCGGVQLYLSGPLGWSLAGGTTRYC